MSRAKKRVPFIGLMTCAACGAQDTGRVDVCKNWRAIKADGVWFYYCPAEFPTASAQEAPGAWSDAYTKLVEAIYMERSPQRPIMEMTIYIERAGKTKYEAMRDKAEFN